MPTLRNYVEHFSNLNQLIHELETRKTNSVFSEERYQVSNKLQRKGPGFYGAKSIEDAFTLCRDGWSEKLEEFKEPGTRMPTKSVKRAALGPVGFAPHVPNAIQGRPDSMIYSKNQRVKTKAISIAVNTSVPWNIEADRIFEAGREIFRAIQSIENDGIRVNLDVIFAASINDSGKQAIAGSVAVKKATERLNPKRIYFPLVHPAMIRIIGFRYMETIPATISTNFKYGYGHCLTDEQMKEVFKNVRLLSMQRILKEYMTAADIKRELLR